MREFKISAAYFQEYTVFENEILFCKFHVASFHLLSNFFLLYVVILCIFPQKGDFLLHKLKSFIKWKLFVLWKSTLIQNLTPNDVIISCWLTFFFQQNKYTRISMRLKYYLISITCWDKLYKNENAQFFTYWFRGLSSNRQYSAKCWCCAKSSIIVLARVQQTRTRITRLRNQGSHWVYLDLQLARYTRYKNIFHQNLSNFGAL